MNYDYISKRILWDIRTAKYKLTKKKTVLEKYYERPVHDVERTNEKISELIMRGAPFMAARYGRTELRTMLAYQNECKNYFFKKQMQKKISRDSGFWGNENDVIKFVSLMEDASKSVDVLGVWNNEMEDFITERFCSKDVFLGKLRGLEPWYSEKSPYSKNFKGKSIVVVHPFKQTILEQWKKREKLFDSEVLPDFHLRVVQAVQTIANNQDARFDSWFEALDYMSKEIESKPYDIAIIGCGAYGFPLAAKCKETGHMAIHMGGATQIMFGIKGNRWDNLPAINHLYNDNWIYPLDCDIPKDYKKVEHGCYWN